MAVVIFLFDSLREKRSELPRKESGAAYLISWLHPGVKMAAVENHFFVYHFARV